MSTRLGSAGYSCRWAADFEIQAVVAEDDFPGLVSAVLIVLAEVEVGVGVAAVEEEAAAVVRSVET